MRSSLPVPELPGCLSCGATRDEALKNVKEAIQAYIESLQKHDEPVPSSISEEIVTVEMNA
jgi:antitoxin HicB